MPARIEIAAELIAEGKILYEQTDTSILEICARMGISRNVLYARIDRWKWQRRRYTSGSGAGAEPSDAPAVTACSTQAEAEDSALEPPEVFYARVCRGVQRQMAIVERVQTGLLPAGAVPSERSVRILATINNVLLEIEATAKLDKVPMNPTTPCPVTSRSSAPNLRKELKRWSMLSIEGQGRVLAQIPLNEWGGLLRDFGFLALKHQKPPDCANNGEPWTTWLILGGRGAGKTRAGAEWVRGIALSDPKARIALIAETEDDAREVMVEGVSGLLAIHSGDERPLWTPSRGRLEWKNGAVAQVFTAENYERLRGPQFSAAWLDELAKWRHAEATFDMLQFGLRLGERPRQVVTTTPRPIALLKRLVADPRTAVTHATTRANALNLAPDFIETILTRYRGTRLGRQEIDGEIVEERNDALWSRAGLEACRVAAAPPLMRVVIAVDPPASARDGADACGIVAAGRADDGTIYVVADESAGGLTPQGWAVKAIALWRRLQADALVAEINMGGDMVKAVMREADASVPVITVRATRGKYLRAEPVSQLYEQGRVKHAGVFPALEDEKCDFGLDGLSSGRSPDRLDALVWAVTALTHAARGEPRIRTL